MQRIAEGVLRLTFPLPLGIGHVHCYLLEGEDGWTLVDTAIAFPGAEEHWREIAAGLDGPLARIVVTHFHPDHVGGAEPAAEATGAPVLQGREDYERCADVWGRPDWSGELADYLCEHGLPEREAAEIRGESALYGSMIRFVRDPEPLEEGDEVAGWRVVHLPGHADGHLCLLRDGVLVAGDHLLPRITPIVGLYPRSRPDPLGDYLVSLARTVELAPRLALPGPRGTDRRPGRPCARAARAPSSPARADCRRPRRRAADGLRGLGRPVRRRPRSEQPPLCGRRDDRASRAAAVRRSAPRGKETADASPILRPSSVGRLFTFQTPSFS